MNTVIVGVGVVVASTAYLIYKCRLLGRRVEIAEPSQKRVEQSAPLPLETALPTRKIEITKAEHTERMSELNKVIAKIQSFGSNKMGATDFIECVTPAIKFFNENGDLGDISKVLSYSTIPEEIGRNREMFKVCVTILQRSGIRLKDGVLSLSKDSDVQIVTQFLDCLKRAFETVNDDEKSNMKKSVLRLLEKVNGEDLSDAARESFLLPYKGIFDWKENEHEEGNDS